MPDHHPELRLADKPTADATVVIDAPPETVWELVSDINLPARFSTEFQGAEWMDGADAAATGARFVGRNRHDAIGEWQTTCTVTRCEPPFVFEWIVEDVDDPTATWQFELEPTEEGGTRVTQRVQIGTGRSGLTPVLQAMPDKESKILHHRLGELRANMQRNLDGIASELASEGGG